MDCISSPVVTCPPIHASQDVCHGCSCSLGIPSLSMGTLCLAVSCAAISSSFTNLTSSSTRVLIDRELSQYLNLVPLVPGLHSNCQHGACTVTVSNEELLQSRRLVQGVAGAQRRMRSMIDLHASGPDGVPVGAAGGGTGGKAPEGTPLMTFAS